MAKASGPEKKRSGPYLDAALICEDLVQEKDWAVTAIRAVNRINMQGVTLAPGVIIALPLVLLISFKAGDVVGDRGLWLYVSGPSRKRRRLMPGINQPHPFSFQGGDTGQLAFIQLHLEYETDGTYWIDVVLGKKWYSRVPLTFMIGNQPSQ
jgi:hypothetical protein